MSRFSIAGIPMHVTINNNIAEIRKCLEGLFHSYPWVQMVVFSELSPHGPNKTAAERHTANAATAVFLAHGQHDDVVVMGRAVAARDTLKGLGYDIQWSEYPMGHSVCMEEVADLEQWLLRVLGA